MKKINLRLVILLLAMTFMVMWVLAPPLAVARDAPIADGGVLHEKVRFSDLNLASASGVEVLYQRIKAASKSVCGVYYESSVSPLLWSMARRCKDTAMEAAVSKVGNTALTQLYETRSRRGDRKGPMLAGRRDPMLAGNVPKVEVSLE